MQSILPIRWYFNVSKWQPTKDEWNQALHCIQAEEKSRIERFVFKEDTKSALVGRLLLRKLVVDMYNKSNNSFTLGRSQQGRPFLEKYPENSNDVDLADFNISHQGAYCVLAAEAKFSVGIDVMQRAFQGGKHIPEFFRLMKRKFTPKEWDFICGPVTEREQTNRFFRLWSLKESFVKVDGRGLEFDLQRLSFTCNSPNLSVGEYVNDTTLSVDGNITNDWTFEETLLDNDHGVAVALNISPSIQKYTKFVNLSISDLISNLELLLPADDQAWSRFEAKPTKKF